MATGYTEMTEYELYTLLGFECEYHEVVTDNWLVQLIKKFTGAKLNTETVLYGEMKL